jgi:hypothetical protein
VKAHDAVLDGEIVCLDARGRSIFKSLLYRRDWPYFYAFDLRAIDWEGPTEVAAHRAEAETPRADSVSADSAALRGPR